MKKHRYHPQCICSDCKPNYLGTVTNQKPIAELIGRSSLGDAQARRLRSKGRRLLGGKRA